MKLIQRPGGFTLVEMMVVIAIIGILAVIAIPAYNNHIEKGELADAKRAASALRQAFEAARLERPRAFKKADDFKKEYEQAKQQAVTADPARLYNFTVRYLPDENQPNGFAVDITPKKTGKKYGLQMEMSGDVLRCEYKDGNLVISTCKKF